MLNNVTKKVAILTASVIAFGLVGCAHTQRTVDKHGNVVYVKQPHPWLGNHDNTAYQVKARPTTKRTVVKTRSRY